MLPNSKNGCHCVNSLKTVWLHWQKQKRQTCSTLLGLVCLTLTNQNQHTVFLWSDNCSLFTDYTHLMHLSLNMLICTTNSIMIYRIQCTVGYIVLSVLSKCWFRTLVPRKHFCPKSRLCEPGITVKPLYSEQSRDPKKCSLFGGVHPRGVRYVHADMCLNYNVQILKLFRPC